ncbi:MAG: KamA family radical SAM protein [Mesorhizobium sp.]|uniref:KamA family radical SAM protein n=1 Tax=unclassified Mesorhizobium TaxID=325217 RepID=UPI000FCAC54E|nr:MULTISPECIES: KamA family radical SAM protein [unclassified Mesorhizobium]RUU68176.1 KamA family radical SAM protein [Mesorhizobium sp. M7A.T.Ca.TU.009.01.1.1]RUU90793.1 KamA family radical SAM protein [Mesorhizobium sp. M7A.T.Ca.TU.009.01.1.2]RUX07714.1 KamA family radical SAM protein [Mesorhizobium sp. M8A.F.Ca.ET.023.01.1.1]RVD60299.1 KamA family radical SAM protein [Mesorhizobium sp. M8A.F.Ca.ET.023.02.2.1]TGR36467.1 KamA family radical SAM protein [bacterium M00.F.Ca.ET.199.01.1.1]TGU
MVAETAAVDTRNSEWDSWRWQLSNSITTLDALKDHINVTAEEEEVFRKVGEKYVFRVTPYYLSLIDKKDPNDPVRLQAIPNIKELDDIFHIDQLASFHRSGVDSENPLWKEGKTEVSCIVHRYPDRVLFHITNLCAIYCRHCSRKVRAGRNAIVSNRDLIDKGIAYIAERPEIRDVLLSGGDPLMMGDNKIEYALSRLRHLPHVQIIRIGTRTPVTMPQRITPEFCEMIKKYHPIWINTHFNHPNEVTPEAKLAIERLLEAGVPVGNQSVLLKGINDSVEVMKELVHKLLMARVRPYYLYHADLVRGAEHFRTSINTGLHIIESLRGHTTGFAVPQYVICTPLGKTPLNPNYLIGSGPGYITLRNYEWRTWKDPDRID